VILLRFITTLSNRIMGSTSSLRDSVAVLMTLFIGVKLYFTQMVDSGTQFNSHFERCRGKNLCKRVFPIRFTCHLDLKLRFHYLLIRQSVFSISFILRVSNNHWCHSLLFIGFISFDCKEKNTLKCVVGRCKIQ
jgi:hypothetical protein